MISRRVVVAAAIGFSSVFTLAFGSDKSLPKLGNEPWKLVIDENYPPYQWKDKDGTFHGIELEVTEAAFKRAGIKYEIAVVPIERGFEMVRRGEKVACVGILKKKERLEYSIIDLPLFTASYPIAVVNKTKASKVKPTMKFQEFLNAGVSIGLVDKYSYTEWADAKLKDLSEKNGVARMSADGIDALQNMVAKGRYDSTLSYPEVYKWWSDRHPADAKNTAVVKFSDVPKENDSSYVMFPKNTDAQTLKKLVDAGNSFRKTDEYKTLMKKYMGE